MKACNGILMLKFGNITDVDGVEGVIDKKICQDCHAGHAHTQRGMTQTKRKTLRVTMRTSAKF